MQCLVSMATATCMNHLQQLTHARWLYSVSKLPVVEHTEYSMTFDIPTHALPNKEISGLTLIKDLQTILSGPVFVCHSGAVVECLCGTQELLLSFE